MAYGLDQVGSRAFAQHLGHCLPFITIACIQSNFDQLVVIQRQFDFLQNSRT